MFNVEKSLKVLIVAAALGLAGTFLTAWFQHSLAHFFSLEDSASFHLTIATVSVLTALFSDTCVLFYFIGTSVWIRDRAKEAFIRQPQAGIEISQIHESANKLKARTFPFATLGIMFGLFTFVLGGANQVGAIPRWLHPGLAGLYLLNAIYAIKHYFRAIDLNLEHLDKVSQKLDSVFSEATEI
jgi:hypothetical protein